MVLPFSDLEYAAFPDWELPPSLIFLELKVKLPIEPSHIIPEIKNAILQPLPACPPSLHPSMYLQERMLPYTLQGGKPPRGRGGAYLQGVEVGQEGKSRPEGSI